jgi:hypothetical protein
MDLLNSKVLRDVEESIKKHIQNEGPSKAEEQVKILIRHLASSQLSEKFERIGGQIFGSQLAILIRANSSPITEDQARNFYDDAVRKFPTTFVNYTFEQYLSYMVTSGLLAKGEKGIFNATELSREFMSYLVRCGLTHERGN